MSLEKFKEGLKDGVIRDINMLHIYLGRYSSLQEKWNLIEGKTSETGNMIYSSYRTGKFIGKNMFPFTIIAASYFGIMYATHALK